MMRVVLLTMAAVLPAMLPAESYVISNGQRVVAPSGCSIVSSSYGTAVAPAGCSLVSSSYGTAVAPAGSSIVSSSNGTAIAPAGSSIVSSSSGTTVTRSSYGTSYGASYRGRYSAISFSKELRRCGSSWNWGNQGLADRKAGESCNQPDCKVVVRAQSMCAALAATKNIGHDSWWARDYNQSRARTIALQNCESHYGDCEIICDTCNH